MIFYDLNQQFKHMVWFSLVFPFIYDDQTANSCLCLG